MNIIEILQTVALCGGALALVWIAIQASTIADYIRSFLDGTGVWLDDDDVLTNPADLPEILERRTSRRGRKTRQ